MSLAWTSRIPVPGSLPTHRPARRARYADAGEVFAALVGSPAGQGDALGVAGLGATAMPEIGSEVLAQVRTPQPEQSQAQTRQDGFKLQLR